MTARDPNSMPVDAARTPARVGLFSSSSCPGLLRSGTSSVLHPTASSRPVSAEILSVLMAVSSGRGLEADVHAEPETPARRERCYVDVPRDRLVPEVADFRVVPVVRYREEQVPCGHGEPGVT